MRTLLKVLRVITLVAFDCLQKNNINILSMSEVPKRKKSVTTLENVVQDAVNMDESLTGMDLDGDGDVGEKANVKTIMEEKLNQIGDSDASSDDLSIEGETAEWPASTVMVVPNAIDEKLIAYFKKYVDKPGNKSRIFQASMTSVGNADTDDEDIVGNDEQIVDNEYRKCSVAKDTNTLNKLFNMLDDTVDSCVDRFVDKYHFFSLVSTKEEYTLLSFEESDFFAEHVEYTGVGNDSDGASRKLCVYVIIDSPEEGGQFEFLYQGCNVKTSPGSIIVFPACALHPLKVSGVQNGRLMYITNYIL